MTVHITTYIPQSFLTNGLILNVHRLLGLDDNNDSSPSKKKLNVVIIEARNRIGGRAYTSDSLQCGVEIDHGGKWIHGSTDKSNCMTQLAREHNIKTTALPKSDPLYYKQKKRRRDIERVVLSSGCNGTKVVQSSTPTRKAENASKLLYNQLCEDEGEVSLIAPLMKSFNAEASYMDCHLQLAKEEPSFMAWLEKQAEAALKAKGNPQLKLKQADMEPPSDSESSSSSDSESSSSGSSSSSSNSEDNGDLSNYNMDDLIRETIALLRLRIYHYLENYEGSCINRCSLLHTYAGDILDGKNAVVEGGHGNLIKKLAEPLDVRYGLEAVNIDSTISQGVVVNCKVNGEDTESTIKTFTAKLGCIIAVPLGVLKRNRIQFKPQLQESLQRSIGRLEMALMNKIEILFPYQWWPAGVGSLSIATESTSSDFPLCNMPFSHFIVEDDSPAILVCYATGMFADRIEDMTNEDVIKETVDAVRVAFLDDGKQEQGTGITAIPDPVRVNATKWGTDKYSHGSWTVFNAGSSMEDVHEFQRFNSGDDSDKKIYFAGEHTCNNSIPGLDIGTIHGAYTSGRVAAECLLKNCED